jgi:N-formylglutamate amidohydrolase
VCVAVVFAALSCKEQGSPAAPTPTEGTGQPTAGYVPGQTYFGRNAYVEFQAGELPVILSAPHGGSLEPAEIPNRTVGTTATDTATEDLARQLALALRTRTGQTVSLVVCRLRRTKIDVNREIVEGAQGNAAAEQAWREYHEYLEAARRLAITRWGRTLVVDVHGHGHAIARVELGYLLSAQDLDRTDAELDGGGYAAQSSIRALAEESGRPFSEVLRGRESLGGLLRQAGYASVPSDAFPSPGTDPYFTGGYITERHGSSGGSQASAVQAELPMPGVRDSSAARAQFATAFAAVLVTYVTIHLKLPL